jgi:nicotinamidase-related amidase
MTTALLIVDIQNDYFPGGPMELEGATEAGLNASRALGKFRDSSNPVIFIQHVSQRPGATFFLPETDGMEIHESVKPLDEDMIFQKQFPNSFRETPLLDHLQKLNVRRLVICGMMTHMCVDATVRAAFDYGFECVVLGDACATRGLLYGDVVIPAEQVHGAFLAALDGIYAKVQSVERFLVS